MTLLIYEVTNMLECDDNNRGIELNRLLNRSVIHSFDMWFCVYQRPVNCLAGGRNRISESLILLY